MENQNRLFMYTNSSYVDEDVQIGEGTTSMAFFASSESGLLLVKTVLLGQNVNIGNNVEIGNL